MYNYIHIYISMYEYINMNVTLKSDTALTVSNFPLSFLTPYSGILRTYLHTINSIFDFLNVMWFTAAEVARFEYFYLSIDITYFMKDDRTCAISRKCTWNHDNKYIYACINYKLDVLIIKCVTTPSNRSRSFVLKM